jgi:hypothetical protein
MTEFLSAVLSFPTVLLSALFVVVVGYWIVMLAGVFEIADVYRAEHLAASLLDTIPSASVSPGDVADEVDLAGPVRRAAEECYDEGYERGVHDHDATTILTALSDTAVRHGRGFT